MAALEIFANMQEKYGEVLSSRTPDVQEANLGDQPRREGRLVLAGGGTAGIAGRCRSLCTQLKAAGYSGCWVTAW